MMPVTLPPTTDAATTDASASCPNCGHQPVGNYCPACGQRQLSRAHYSLGHLAGELGANLLQWDNKLLRTLTLSLVKPGELSALHLAGVRSRYSSPVTLLLLVFFVFFVGQVPLTDFTLPLAAHLEWGTWYAAPAAEWLQTQASADKGGMTALTAAFAQQQQELAKSLVLLLVPLFAMALMLLHWRRDLYYVEHVIVASHIVVTLMLVVLLIVLLLFMPIELYFQPAKVPEHVKQATMLFGLKIPTALVLLLTLKHAYRQSWWLALLKLPLAILALGMALMLYRAVVFWLTLALL